MSEQPFDVDVPVDAASENDDLAAFDDTFAAAVPLASSEVPDGRYDVRVASATLGWSRKGDRMLTYDLVVLSGPHADRHIFKNSVFTDASMPVLKGDLRKLGLELVRISDLPSRLGGLAGLTLTVTKKTKGEYANVSFGKAVTPF